MPDVEEPFFEPEEVGEDRPNVGVQRQVEEAATFEDAKNFIKLP